MKSFKYKFSSDSYRLPGATLFTRIVFSAQIFCGIFIGSTQFMTYFQCAILDSSVCEMEFCTIVPLYSSKNFLHTQTERECLRTKINTQQRVV